MTKIKKLTLVFLTIVLVFLCVNYYLSSIIEFRIPYTDLTAVSNGQDIYNKECASCHGVNLQGQASWKVRDSNGFLPAPPHDSSGHTWHHDDQLLFKLTKYGVQSIAGKNYKSNMPSFENRLTDQQIWNVLAYIKSEWPEDLAQRHTEMVNNK
jgi:mono/diheme cytochrome c family protein